MILSGWILHDLYEVKCSSCSVINGHVQVVRNYLDKLYFCDKETYSKLMQLLDKLKDDCPFLSLDDFAVMAMGWIKINNRPINMVFYSNYNDLDYIIKRYVKIGYEAVVLQGCSQTIQSNIPSYKLI